MIKEARSRTSDSTLLDKGEHVIAVKSGAKLVLVQSRTTENGPKRCWVPGHWLCRAEQSSTEMSKDDTMESLGGRSFSEYSSVKSYPESDFSTELSRTSSFVSTEGSSHNRKCIHSKNVITGRHAQVF